MPSALGTACAIEHPDTSHKEECVDVKRSGQILGVSWAVIVRLADQGHLRLVGYRPRGWKRVSYKSIVEHCNRLREEYAIPDRRPALSSPVMRCRDEDLLPFPLRDTIGVIDIQPVLGFSTDVPVRKILEKRLFECYRLHPSAPWRIFAPSFREYLNRSVVGVTRGPHAYKAVE